LRQKSQEIEIKSLLSGDGQAWEAFVRKLSPIIFNVIRKTLQSSGIYKDEAHDLLQDFFVRLCANDFHILRQYAPQKASITTYLSIVARNMTLDHLRRRRNHFLSLEDLPEQSSGPEGQKGAKVDVPFNVLPPRQLLVMRLLYEKDMDVKEVSDFLGITEQTVRSMRHKAVSKLRESLKNLDS